MRKGTIIAAGLLTAAAAIGSGCFFKLECTEDDTCQPGTGAGTTTTTSTRE